MAQHDRGVALPDAAMRDGIKLIDLQRRLERLTSDLCADRARRGDLEAVGGPGTAGGDRPPRSLQRPVPSASEDARRAVRPVFVRRRDTAEGVFVECGTERNDHWRRSGGAGSRLAVELRARFTGAELGRPGHVVRRTQHATLEQMSVAMLRPSVASLPIARALQLRERTGSTPKSRTAEPKTYRRCMPRSAQPASSIPGPLR